MAKEDSRPLESKIQTKIIKRLEKFNYLVIRLRATNKAGFPDLIAFKKYVRGKKFFFVEVKRSGEKPTPLQLYTHKFLKSLGFTVYVWDENTIIENILHQ